MKSLTSIKNKKLEDQSLLTIIDNCQRMHLLSRNFKRRQIFTEKLLQRTSTGADTNPLKTQEKNGYLFI